MEHQMPQNCCLIIADSHMSQLILSHNNTITLQESRSQPFTTVISAV